MYGLAAECEIPPSPTPRRVRIHDFFADLVFSPLILSRIAMGRSSGWDGDAGLRGDHGVQHDSG